MKFLEIFEVYLQYKSLVVFTARVSKVGYVGVNPFKATDRWIATHIPSIQVISIRIHQVVGGLVGIESFDIRVVDFGKPLR